MLDSITKQKLLISIILFYFLFSLNHIFYGGIFYDDWSLTVGHLSQLSFNDKFFDLVFKTFLTRPIGGIYLSFLTELKKLDYLYILINSTFWMFSSLIIYNSFKKLLSKKSRIYILLLLLFPSFASTIIFSPVTQTLGVMSIFFWSISLFFAKKQKYFLSTLFFIISIFTYEVSIILLFFNIIFFSIEKNKILANRFIKSLILFIFITLGIIFFQIILSKIFNHSGTLKYAFMFENNQLFFEEDFFSNIKKYFFKPLTLITYDIPKLLINSIIFFKFKFFNIFIVLFFILLIIINYKDDTKNSSTINNRNIFLFITLSFSTIAVFFVYLIVSSVPQVNGYYNRGLVGLFICFSLGMGLLNDINFKNKIVNNVKFFFITTVVFLNFNSFLIQQNRHISAEEERVKILNEVINFYKTNNNITTSKAYSPIILMIIPTYLEDNYNDEAIFSEEVEDLYFAVNYVTKEKVLAKRIYYDKKCSNIFNINNNLISGLVTSKNRKYKAKEKTTLYNFSSRDRNIYLYNNSRFIKLSYDNKINDEILKNNLKCQI